jgi:glucose 1-dehydrogenase
MSHPASSTDWLGLAGRVAIVTGAGSGIGEATARGLAEAGAHVAIVDRDTVAAQRVAKGLSGTGAKTLAVACDVTSEDDVRRAADQIRSALGPCSTLVNNAGILRPGALDTLTLAEWNQVLAVNLTAYLICARAFGAEMLASGHGSMIHVASIAALHPQTRSGAYSASKAGVLLLSKQMAAEWGPRGVRSNAICPGMIRTPLSAAFYKEPGFEARRAAVTANRRIGEPIDIANTALFLASDRSNYINGTEIVVDGGLDCMLMDMVPRPGFNATPAD